MVCVVIHIIQYFSCESATLHLLVIRYILKINNNKHFNCSRIHLKSYHSININSISTLNFNNLAEKKIDSLLNNKRWYSYLLIEKVDEVLYRLPSNDCF